MLEIYMENSNGIATSLNEGIVFDNNVLQTGCTATTNTPTNTVRLNKAGFYSVHIDGVIANNTAVSGLVGIQLYNNNTEVSNAYTAQTSTGNTNLVAVGFDTVVQVRPSCSMIDNTANLQFKIANNNAMVYFANVVVTKIA
jgi:hypothetical protein|nr:MAG TPA: hypothetical protein [Caudoviricetes sp.]